MAKVSEFPGSESSTSLFDKLFKKYDFKIFGGNMKVDESISIYQNKIDINQFPVRFQHILKFFKINRLGPILNLDFEVFSRFPNIGSKTIGISYSILDKIIEGVSFEKIQNEHEISGMKKSLKESPPVNHTDKNRTKSNKPVSPNNLEDEDEKSLTTFFEALENELTKLPSKSKEMLESALIKGFTLEAIAKENSLTRERIRQIINSKIRKMADNLIQYRGSLEQDLLEIVLENPKLIGIDYFAGQKYGALFLMRLVARMYPDLPIEENRLNLKNRDILQRYESSIKTISFILRNKIFVEIGEFINQLYRSSPEKFIRSLTVLLSWDGIIITPGEFRAFVSAYPKRLHDHIMLILSVSNNPLSLEEIFNRIDRHEYSKSSVKAKLENDSDFYRIDKKLFGLFHHLPLSKNEINSIISKSEHIVENEGLSIHISQILNHLKDSFPQLKSKYLLYSILKNSSEFASHRGMSISAQSNYNHLREIKEIVLDLLKSQGVPLHRSEIVAKIKSERFFNEMGWGTIVKSIPGIMQYGATYYGLSSRQAFNLDYLSGSEEYLQKTLEEELCPYTTERDIHTFFRDYNVSKVFATLKISRNFIELEDVENSKSFFVNKKWNISNIVKTILLYQENATISENFLANYLRRVDVSSIKDSSKLSQHNIFHLKASKKYVFLTPEIVSDKENLVREYIQFLTITGHIHSFDQVTFHLNKKLKLSLTIFQTEAIYRIWIRSQIK